MPLPKYEYTGPIDHTVIPDRSKMVGRSVIITGGANGMGEVMVRQFVDAGAFVTFGDMHPRGAKVEQELNANGENAAFVKCDIRNWDDQVNLFETARSRSPNGSVDVVIANAGISRSSGDSLWVLDGMSIFSGHNLDRRKCNDFVLMVRGIMGIFAHRWQIRTIHLPGLSSISST
jgi:NAD(P)-dependent dehydrogenase (short-subunit alcohol dehydrogenase family)